MVERCCLKTQVVGQQENELMKARVHHRSTDIQEHYPLDLAGSRRYSWSFSWEHDRSAMPSEHCREGARMTPTCLEDGAFSRDGSGYLWIPEWQQD